MNGFAEHKSGHLDESTFGEKDPLRVVKAFDAFPKTKPSYAEKTESGGVWTIVLVCFSLWLAGTEFNRWWWGKTTHEFSVEQGVGHDLQLNLDIVVAMPCQDLHVNVQDASGDRIMAGQALHKDSTTWAQWHRGRGYHKNRGGDGETQTYELVTQKYREEDVHDYLHAARDTRKFRRTPKLPRGVGDGGSCRIFGSMHSNKVQGDFHITARGHGYTEFGSHLDHHAFNFSHQINELSFGPFYPSLINPLDNTFATTADNFYKFQYYLSVVPTIYTTDATALAKLPAPPESPSSGSDGLEQHPKRHSTKTVFTNQYAVTEQSHPVPENQVPGVFVKFDIEPIMLTIAEERSSIAALIIRLVNVVAGVLVAGGWCYQLNQWAQDFRGRRRNTRTESFGMLNGSMDEKKRAM